MKRRRARPMAHPRSLASRAGYDPELRRRLKEGRTRAMSDGAAMERWARQGCHSGGASR